MRGIIEKLKRNELERLSLSLPIEDMFDELIQALSLATKLKSVTIARYSGIHTGNSERLIFKALHNCPSLTELKLKNGLGNTGAETLAWVLPECPSLTSLHFDSQYRNFVRASGAQALARVLPRCPSLTSLNLMKNQIGDLGAQALAEVLPQCRSLTTLNLISNEIGELGARALAAALPQSPSLTSLNLGHNSLRESGAKALAAVLPQCPSLTSLHLASNFFGDSGAKALVAVLPHCHSLSSLNLSHNRIGDSGAQALAGVLPRFPSLTSLNLWGNHGIRTLGAESLAAVLPGCPSLSSLDLSMAQIGDSGAKALAAILPRCRSLISLNLGSSKIGNAGVRALATVLPECPSLTSLDLSSSEIESAGVQALATVLPQCPSLTSLNLGSNEFGDSGVKALAKVLPKCPSLTSLNLWGTKIGESGAKVLAAILPECLSLTFLDLGGNEFGDSGAKALAAILPRCPSLTSLSFDSWKNNPSIIAPIGEQLEKHQLSSRGLISAVKAGSNMTGVWISRGASVYSRTEKHNNTPLHLAAKYGHLRIVKHLIEKKAPIRVFNLEGKTPETLAREANQMAVVNYLQSFSAPAPAPARAPEYGLPPRINSSHERASAPVLTNSLAAAVPRRDAQSAMAASAPRANHSSPMLGIEMNAISIPRAQLEFGDRLGEGSFGDVFRGVWHHTALFGTTVAIKQLKLRNLPAKLLADFQSEVQILAKLDSPQVVKLYGVTAESPYCMVMEFMERGSLRDVLDQHEPEQLEWVSKLQISKDIASGLVYLHGQQPFIVHGDFKSLNILVDNNFRAKIGDFGLAALKIQSSSRYSESSTTAQSNRPKGSVLWMAPELFGRNAKRSRACDIYSFAMVLWEIASHKFPFSDAQDISLVPGWVVKGEREEFGDNTPNTPIEYQEVAKQCWDQDPEKRLSAQAALNRLNQITLFGKNPAVQNIKNNNNLPPTSNRPSSGRGF